MERGPGWGRGVGAEGVLGGWGGGYVLAPEAARRGWPWWPCWSVREGRQRPSELERVEATSVRHPTPPRSCPLRAWVHQPHAELEGLTVLAAEG